MFDEQIAHEQARARLVTETKLLFFMAWGVQLIIFIPLCNNESRVADTHFDTSPSYKSFLHTLLLIVTRNLSRSNAW